MAAQPVPDLDRIFRAEYGRAVAELDGPAAPLALTDALQLDHYHLFHAVRADLLRRLGRDAEATVACDAAIAGDGNLREREYLRGRRRSLAVDR
jgi:RNA polymerase sigma-70 factor (ECF subfamily)